MKKRLTMSCKHVPYPCSVQLFRKGRWSYLDANFGRACPSIFATRGYFRNLSASNHWQRLEFSHRRVQVANKK